jgi:D-alanyl-D-alanine carboxypeptidase/D-alanyl-D-alanine-endopeptidase (penicillin-binding protein 4)
MLHPAFPTGDATPLGAKIDAFLADPSVSRAHWGIAVTALDGTPIYGLDEGKLFRPASTAKLFTTAAALAMLGPDDRFTTRLLAEGSLEHGVLHGNLILRGGGDANFDSETLLPYQSPADRKLHPRVPPAPLAAINEFAGEITMNANLQVSFTDADGKPLPGVGSEDLKVIEGDIVGDDTYFENLPYAEGWSTDDLLWGYGAPVAALTIHDNLIDIAITPAADGHSAASISLAPDVPYYRINATRPGDAFVPSVQTRHWDRLPLQELVRLPGSRDLEISGDVRPGQTTAHHQIAIDDPAEYAAIALREALERRGVIVKGMVRVQHRAPSSLDSFFAESHQPILMPQQMLEAIFRGKKLSCNAQVVANRGALPQTELSTATSAPLIEDLTMTLKTSDNLHAEVMLRNLSAERMCGSGLAMSVQLMRQYWIHAGLDPNDFVFYDGSGLSTKDLVTPRATAQLLAFATKQPWFAQWKPALPVGGVDGTLSERFKEAPLKGHVFAKTGTLGESRALAGYVDCASGRQVIFSIMIDDHTPGSSADRTVMDKIVAAIAASN